MKNLMITGYKSNELNIFNRNDKRIFFIKEAIRKRIIPLIENEGIEWVLISGQSGTELWAGEVVLELKEHYDIKLAVIPPFLNQEQVWKEEQQSLYQTVVGQADFYQSLVKKEYEGPYQFKRKDRWFLEKSDACLLLYDEEQEGSPKFFLREAEKQDSHLPIFFIQSFDLEETVREIQENASDFTYDS
ncbi:DUF1273 domain-containing protein [Virgibacillus sp. MSP4-1]|uniref:SLOG family protein n=1 Tax=Virgibacillus sp. MSP4-1 TaxID=2700081 RepID=UPI0003AA6E56|nr:DUF1273 domain-containing protein [Virgibacillus sp. MSP4-1]QHS22549.1 DUF1273 domain-containing protein [Virgibacillus sp. MSP4-1]